MRFALYLRASTIAQEDSTTTQSLLLQEWATGHGHSITASFSDEATSGSVPVNQRPGASALLLEAADKRRSFDAILVIRKDRLFRNLLDEIETMRYLQRHKCAIWTPEGEIDRSTPEGELLSNIIGSIAQFERQLVGQRIKEHNLARALQGKLPSGYAPLGYVYDPARKVLEVSDRADDAQRIFAWYAETGNAGQTAKRAIAAGIRGQRGAVMSANSILQVLRCPVYRRQFTYAGRTIDAPETIPALIPPEILETVDRHLARRVTLPSRSKGAAGTYAGLVVCAECGARLHRKGAGWRCPNAMVHLCASKGISQRYLHQLTGQALVALCAHLAAAGDVPMPKRAEETAARRRQLESRRERWAILFADGGSITRQQYQQHVQEIERQLAALPDTPPPPKVWKGEDALLALRAVAEAWALLPDGERRRLLLDLGAEIEVTSKQGTPRGLLLRTTTGAPAIPAAFQHAYTCRPGAPPPKMLQVGR